MKIHGMSASTHSQTALLVAAEATGRTIAPTALPHHQPSHFAPHPYGRMPSLEHGALVQSVSGPGSTQS